MVLSFNVCYANNDNNMWKFRECRQKTVLCYEWRIYGGMYSINCRYADKLIYANNYIIWMSFVRMIGWL